MAFFSYARFLTMKMKEDAGHEDRTNQIIR